jgi:hypothetical protein
VLEVDAEKNYYYFNERSMLSQKRGKFKKGLLRAIDEHFGFNDSDCPADFDHYFPSSNPRHLLRIRLQRNRVPHSHPVIPSLP